MLDDLMADGTYKEMKRLVKDGLRWRVATKLLNSTTKHPTNEIIDY